MKRRPLCRVVVVVGFVLVGLSLALLGLQRVVLAAPTGIIRSYPDVTPPCNTTLQACINGSSAGDAISIAANVYITSVTLNKAVSLIGAGAGSTILQALPGQRVMAVTAAMNSSTQIAGLTLQGGNAGAANGGGLYLSAGAQPLIQNISVNANFAQSGGGIYAASPITLANVSVSSNAATNGSGGGVYVAGNSVVMNSVIQNKTVVTNRHGGGILVNGKFHRDRCEIHRQSGEQRLRWRRSLRERRGEADRRPIRQQPDYPIERLWRRWRPD